MKPDSACDLKRLKLKFDSNITFCLASGLQPELYVLGTPKGIRHASSSREGLICDLSVVL